MNRGLLPVIALIAAALHFPDAAAQGERLPIADLHFHADSTLAPAAVLESMDRAGVRWAGNGAKGADTQWRPYVAAAPDRFIPFAGQGAIGVHIRERGEAAWNLKSPELERYLEVAEQGLRAGRFRGIGELFVDNLHSHQPEFPSTRYPADSPLMRRLLALSVTYHVPLSVHMEAEPAAVEELERLLAADRNGTVIWAHCGFWIEPDALQALMDRNSNLLCELSHRDDRAHAHRLRMSPITGSQRRLKPGWKTLLEKHSDRFLIGTDVDDQVHYGDVIAFYREVLAQLSPDVAKQVAYGNAQRLFALDRRPNAGSQP